MNNIDLKNKITNSLVSSEEYNNLDISIDTLDQFINKCHMDGNKIVFTESRSKKKSLSELNQQDIRITFCLVNYVTINSF